MADKGTEDGALIARLRLIESQELAERAVGYARVHAELVEILEGQDVSPVDE